MFLQGEYCYKVTNCLLFIAGDCGRLHSQGQDQGEPHPNLSASMSLYFIYLMFTCFSVWGSGTTSPVTTAITCVSLPAKHITLCQLGMKVSFLPVQIWGQRYIGRIAKLLKLFLPDHVSYLCDCDMRKADTLCLHPLIVLLTILLVCTGHSA